jgi:hypothetical protein
MISPKEPAALAHVGVRTLYHLVKAERLHFTENLDGQLSVRLNSLLKQT